MGELKWMLKWRKRKRLGANKLKPNKKLTVKDKNLVKILLWGGGKGKTSFSTKSLKKFY